MKEIYLLRGRSMISMALMLFLLLLTSTAYSQQNIIRLIDKSSKQPVDNVYFKYKSIAGISTVQGEISIDFEENEILFLSHIQYGKLEISPNDVKTAFKNGFLQLETHTSNLLPVTVLVIHPDAGSESYIDVPVQEKLEYDAGQLLEQLTGISTIRKSASYGFDPVLHGFKYDQLNLVIDGIQTASAACPNRMDPASSQIPINMISKVEVIKGPYSLRYGNSFGGTINFKSSLPKFSEKTTPAGRFGTSFESNGNVMRTEGVAGITGKRVDLKVFGSYSQGDDYKDGAGIVIPAAFNRLNWGGKLGFKLGERQNMGLLLSNNRAKDVDFPTLPMDLRDDNTWLLNASHSVYFYNQTLTSWNTSAYLTRVNHLMDNFDKVIVPRTVDAETKANTLNYGGRTETRFDLNDSYLFTGIDYRFESAEGERTRNMLMGPMTGKSLIDNVWQDAQIQRTGVFGEFHVEKSDFYLVFSGRLDYNSAISNHPDPNFTLVYPEMESQFLNPSFSAGGTKMLNSTFSLGLWLGTAQRSPGIAERYINFFPVGLDPYELIGNPQLKPETNNQVDLIFEVNFSGTKIKLDIFSSVLLNYISSEIDPALKPRMSTSPGVRKYVNIENAQISGFELEWEQTITTFLKHNFSAAYLYGTDKKLDEPLPEITPFELKYRLIGSVLDGKIMPELYFRQALKQERIAKSFGETVTPAFHVVDAKISWFINRNISATGGVQNVFNKAYYEHLARSIRSTETRPIYSPGRSFYATLTFNFL